MDRKSKIFLRFMDQQPEKEILYIDDIIYPEGLGDEDDILALIRYLEETGYLETIQASNSGAILGVCLSHKGRNRRYFAWQEFLRYIEDKWIDFFALLAAIGALIISIIALLK